MRLSHKYKFLPVGRIAQASHPSPLARVAGFTLLELLVVLVIIGLLASYVGPRVFAQLGKSETKVAKARLRRWARHSIPTGSIPAIIRAPNRGWRH